MEHLAGKAVDKTAQFLYSRRLKKWRADAAPFYLRENLKRFAILSSFLAGRDLRAVEVKGDTPPRPYLPILKKMAHPSILPDHGFGWSDGETLFLPVSIVDMPAYDEQAGLSKLLIFFLSAQVKHGSLDTARKNRQLLISDRALADTYWILENTRLFHLMEKDFPGLFRYWKRVSAHLLGRRPEIFNLRPSERKVEELLCDLLNGAVSRSPVYLNGPEESLVAAMDIKATWLKEGLSFKRYRALVPFAPWGKLIPGRLKDGLLRPDSQEVNDEEEAHEEGEKPEDAKNKGERTRYVATREVIDEEACEQGLLLNIYDKIVSWADFVNVSRPFDDDPEDDYDKKAGEMEELTTAETSRQAASYFDADLEQIDAHDEKLLRALPESEKVYFYPEWDYRKKCFREDYSRLAEVEVEGGDIGFVKQVLSERRGVIKEVRRKFEMLTPEVRQTNRQFEGDQIDIDAAVEALVDIKAGGQAGEKLYRSSRNTERDLSVLFLVDLSMSTDAWVKDRRVIDHEKEALVVLCEVMDKLKDGYAIYGFSGKTRKGCSFFKIKGFDESYNENVRRRIGGLIPYEYTRMGPAVRHAAHILKKQSSMAKLLFIISDGKPNDMDSYEGKYGVEDTRMAIKGVEKEGIIPFCLTVDSKSQEYLPRIFGKGNHVVLAGTDKLSKKLPEFYGRIIQHL